VQLQQQQQQHAAAAAAGTKLEKAELLELTVAYVCRVQDDVERQMSLGFASCMREVDAFLAQTGNGSDVDAQLRAHLARRLARCRRRRHIAGSAAVFTQQTASSAILTGSGRHGDEDRPSSSSGCGLAPRKLRFDDSRPTRPLRDVNDQARYDQLSSGGLYRRPAALCSGSENVDVVGADTATVSVDAHISSTTSAQLRDDAGGPHADHVTAFDLSNNTVKQEPLTTPVWRPW